VVALNRPRIEFVGRFVLTTYLVNTPRRPVPRECEVDNRSVIERFGATTNKSRIVEMLDSFAFESIVGPNGRNHRKNRRIRVDWYET